MQNDLISRKRVIENIWDVFNSYANDSQRFDEYETEAINNAFKVLQKVIENQPTAYDVEKVVAELEELKQREYDDSDEEECFADAEECFDAGVSDGKYRAYTKAIDIVRNGGKE